MADDITNPAEDKTKVDVQQQTPEQVAADKAAADKAPADKTVADKAATDKAAADKAEAEKSEKEKADKDAKELDTATWGDLKDDTANSVLLLLQNSGVTPDQAKALLYDATKAGKPEQINRDKLVEAVGATNATLIMAGIENYIGKVAARTSESNNVLYTAAGGKENWDKIAEWAKKELSAEELEDYIAMVNAGGRKISLAAKDLKERYEDKHGTLKPGTIIPEGGNPAKEEIVGISRQDYYKELDKLNRRPGKADKTAQDALWARRAAGKKQGI